MSNIFSKQSVVIFTVNGSGVSFILYVLFDRNSAGFIFIAKQIFMRFPFSLRFVNVSRREYCKKQSIILY